MRDAGDHYEYIAVYVDDLLIASKDPQSIIKSLTDKPNNFKLKGTGPVTYHLGCDFFRDADNVLCMAPKKYIERMVAQYTKLFGQAPSQRVQSPLEKNDHPELDDTELLDEEDTAKYQSLIGVLQWTISLGRFDIATAVMTMSSFRAMPRTGHLERVKRICGYLVKFKDACIRVRTGIPDYSDLPKKEYDWARTTYGKVRESIPTELLPRKERRLCPLRTRTPTCTMTWPQGRQSREYCTSSTRHRSIGSRKSRQLSRQPRTVLNSQRRELLYSRLPHCA